MKLNLDLLKSGDELLVRNEGRFIGNQIERNQLKAGFSPEDSEYTHVEVLALRDRLDPSKFWSVCVAPPKTKLVNFPEYYKGRYVKIVRYKEYVCFGRLKDVAVWAVSHVNVPYDVRGVLRFIFVWIKQHTSKWFCSENGCWSLQQVYFKALKGMKPENSMPADFCCKEFETIYEGRI